MSAFVTFILNWVYDISSMDAFLLSILHRALGQVIVLPRLSSATIKQQTSNGFIHVNGIRVLLFDLFSR